MKNLADSIPRGTRLVFPAGDQWPSMPMCLAAQSKRDAVARQLRALDVTIGIGRYKSDGFTTYMIEIK